MKWLSVLLDRFRPLFEEGKLRPLKPLFDATDAFFLSPETCTEVAPHVRDPLDVKRFMSIVIVALLPATLASIYFFGLRSIAVIIVSYAAGGTVEAIFAIVRKEEINEGFLVTGLIFPLVLPPTIPLWMVAVGAAFGVLIGKELFGGTGRNLFNPALVGRCFLTIAYPKAMAPGWVTPGTGMLGRLTEYVTPTNVDAIISATPLAEAKQVLAGTTDVALPSLSEMFIGRTAGCLGETSTLLILLGGVFLLATRVANWRTVVGILVPFAVLGAILHAIIPETFGPVAWNLCAGGLMFGAFFMATDPVTSPITNAGKWAYGILIGVVALLIRNLTGFMEGMMFAILLGNISAPLMDEVVFRMRVRSYKGK